MFLVILVGLKSFGVLLDSLLWVHALLSTVDLLRRSDGSDPFPLFLFSFLSVVLSSTAGVSAKTPPRQLVANLQSFICIKDLTQEHKRKRRKQRKKFFGWSLLGNSTHSFIVVSGSCLSFIRKWKLFIAW